jgi:hypothetical protein
MVFRDSAEGTAKVSTTRAVEARHTHTAHNRVCLSIFAPPNHRMRRHSSQSSNLRAQICRLSGARLMLAVRRPRGAPLSHSEQDDNFNTLQHRDR